MKILLAAFEPFGDSTLNSSWEILGLIPKTIGGLEVEKVRLPVVFGLAGERLAAQIAELKPDAVICFGEAADRDVISIERVALNVRDSESEDNAGKAPREEVIIEDGPVAYFSTLPTKAMMIAMERKGEVAQMSNSAGTYVCNDVFYQLMDVCDGTEMLGGFIHVPALHKKLNGNDLEGRMKRIAAAIESAVYQLYAI